MLSTQHPDASAIVLRAIRKHLDAIESGINGYYQDSTKFEELDESIRRARIAKCATAIIGSPTLNRMLSFHEDVLESIALGQRELDDDALSVLTTLTSATATYIDAQSAAQPLASDVVDASHEELATSVRAYRRYLDLSDADDGRAISELFRGSHTLDTRESEIDEASDSVAVSSAGPHDSSFHLEGESVDPIDPELLEVFQEEAEDHIQKIYAGLSQLEKEPANRDQIQDVRRAAHTFKGAAGAIGLSELSRLSHRMEDVLDELYDGEVGLTREHLALLLETTDVLQDCCLGDRARGDSREKIPRLYAAYDSLGADPSADSSAPSEVGEPKSNGEESSTSQVDTAPENGNRKPQSLRTLRVPASRLDDICNVVGELMIHRTSLDQIVDRFVQCVDELQPVLDRLRSVSHQLETKYEVPALLSHGATRADWAAHNSLSPRSERDAEFDELELDRYTDFHLLSRSLAEATSDTSAVSHELRTMIGDFQALLARQSGLTRDAQSRLMRIRMVPFGSLTSRLTRALREVADHQQKNVELIIEGETTALDKTVLEELLDPLLHLMRNAVDHGIESAETRREQSKPETASVRLRAFHHGSQVVIEMSDDGKGLDAEKIRDGVVQGGYLDAERAQSLTPDELYSYIFIPGFSTAASISEISGRGVGMDIVRCNIEKLKGRIEVQSSPGEGTTFAIRLPTTLLVTRALIAMTKNETFAIPTHAVAKILKVSFDQIESRRDDATVRIDGSSYPLVRLNSHLELVPVHNSADETLTVAIVETGDRVVALSFDTILSTRDIVVKSLGTHLGLVRGLLGATVLGDGSVVPILDPPELTTATEPTSCKRPVSELPEWEWQDVSVLIVDDSVSVRRALGNLVQRAEWTPITARDGLDALEIIDGLKQPPNVVLLDVEMPRMDGYELLAALRGKPEFQRIPILMITSRAGEKHRRKAIELGATAYVSKPFQDEPLLQLIRRHIAQSRQQ